MKLTKLNVYEYPIKDINGDTYKGMYTLKDGVAPKNYEKEKLVQTFEAYVKE
jgi:hypothetical protein